MGLNSATCPVPRLSQHSSFLGRRPLSIKAIPAPSNPLSRLPAAAVGLLSSPRSRPLLSISLAPPMFFHRIPTYYGVKVRRPLLKYFYQNTATPKTHHIYTEIHTELGRMMCACLYLKVWWCAVFALTPYMVRNLYDFYVYVYRKDNRINVSFLKTTRFFI